MTPQDEIFPPGGEAVVKRYGTFPEEQYVIHPDALRRFLACGVYKLSKNDAALYIGSAKNILGRISDDSHESFRLALCEADWVTFLMAKFEADARHTEGFMIASEQPKYNIAGKSATCSAAKAIKEAALDIGKLNRRT